MYKQSLKLMFYGTDFPLVVMRIDDNLLLFNVLQLVVC